MSISKEKLEQLEEMLNKRKWAKDCLRANIAQEDKIIYRGPKKKMLRLPFYRARYYLRKKSN